MNDPIKQYIVMDILLDNWDGILVRLGVPDLALDKELRALVKAISRTVGHVERAELIEKLLVLLKSTAASEYIRQLLVDAIDHPHSLSISHLEELHENCQAQAKPHRRLPPFSEFEIPLMAVGSLIAGFCTTGFHGISLDRKTEKALALAIGTGLLVHRSVVGASHLLRRKVTTQTDPCQVTIYFATDRHPDDARADVLSSKPADRLTYGKIGVNIPVQRHRIGKIERRGFWEVLRNKTDPRRYMVVDSPCFLPVDSFAREIGTSFDSIKDILVFVHGYNVDFETAARRAAQLAFDLGFRGRVVLYTWPSSGKCFSYNHDAEQSLNSAVRFSEFLRSLSDGPWEKIHILAHSMGSRVMLEGLTESGWPNDQIGQVVFAAADINVERFRQKFPCVARKAATCTSYASRSDRALLISDLLHSFERVGLPKQAPFVLDGLETVDASAVRCGFLGHGYFAETPAVMKDITTLLEKGLPASRRGLLRHKQQKYWSFSWHQ